MSASAHLPSANAQCDPERVSAGSPKCFLTRASRYILASVKEDEEWAERAAMKVGSSTPEPLLKKTLPASKTRCGYSFLVLRPSTAVSDGRRESRRMLCSMVRGLSTSSL